MFMEVLVRKDGVGFNEFVLVKIGVELEEVGLLRRVGEEIVGDNFLFLVVEE